MRGPNEPVYMISVAAGLCEVHPQTLRQYERLGLIKPSRAGAKNRLFSDNDIARIKKIKRLTQDMGVNLAGVEVILRLIDQIEEVSGQMEQRYAEYVKAAEERITYLLQNTSVPIRRDESLLPVPTLLPKDFRIDI